MRLCWGCRLWKGYKRRATLRGIEGSSESDAGLDLPCPLANKAVRFQIRGTDDSGGPSDTPGKRTILSVLTVLRLTQRIGLTAEDCNAQTCF